TDVACHRPPRAVRIARRLSSSAIACTLVIPELRTSVRRYPWRHQHIGHGCHLSCELMHPRLRAEGGTVELSAAIADLRDAGTSVARGGDYARLLRGKPALCCRRPPPPPPPAS